MKRNSFPYSIATCILNSCIIPFFRLFSLCPRRTLKFCSETRKVPTLDVFYLCQSKQFLESPSDSKNHNALFLQYLKFCHSDATTDRANSLHDLCDDSDDSEVLEAVIERSLERKPDGKLFCECGTMPR